MEKLARWPADKIVGAATKDRKIEKEAGEEWQVVTRKVKKKIKVIPEAEKQEGSKLFGHEDIVAGGCKRIFKATYCSKSSKENTKNEVPMILKGAASLLSECLKNETYFQMQKDMVKMSTAQIASDYTTETFNL